MSQQEPRSGSAAAPGEQPAPEQPAEGPTAAAGAAPAPEPAAAGGAGSAPVAGAAPAPKPAAAGAAGSAPDLRYGDVEEELRQAVRALFSQRCPLPAVLAQTEEAGGRAGRGGTGGDGTSGGGMAGSGTGGVWPALAAELGCAGLLIPESLGGAGAGYREAAVVAEETGWAAAPVPYLGSAVVATAALLATGDELLRPLAVGQVTAALAVDFGSWPRLAGGDWQPTGGPALAAGPGVPAAGVTLPAGLLASGVRVGPARSGDPAGVSRLTGTICGVADAGAASVLLVPADGVPAGLYAVDASDPGVRREPVVSLDETRPLTDITLADVPARRVVAGEAAAQAVAGALTAGAAMLASELLGTGARCLEMTVAYVAERRQFGRPVGSFQALKHRLADVWVALAQARAAARYAAACLAESDPDAPVAVALAKATCGDAAVHAAEECVQMHGGIGFTWEHPAHLLLKRAKSASLAFGSPDSHRAALAHLVQLPPP